jgi:hypothetical protein
MQSLDCRSTTFASMREVWMIAQRGWSSLLMASTAAWAVVFAGCSSASPSNGGPGIRIEDLPAAYADALCNNIGPCCEKEGYAYNAMTCRAKVDFILKSEAASTQRQGLPYDPMGARACVDTVASLAQSCSADNVEATYQAACGRVYAGHQPEGAVCTSGHQCASGDCLTGPARPWHCGGPNGPVRGKLGDNCNATCYPDSKDGTLGCYPDYFGPQTGFVQCFVDEEMFCDLQTSICTAKADVGQACGPSIGCRSGASCENGVCGWKRTDGPCTDNDGCPPTAYCGYSTPRQCVPRKARGENCGSDEQCAVEDDCNKTCRGVTLASAGTCM